MANTINGVDLAALGFTVEDPSGFLDAPPSDREWVHVVREYGGRSRADRLNERNFRLIGHVVGTDNATAKANYQLLKALCLRGVRSALTIILEDRTGYYVRAKYGGVAMEPDGPTHHTRGLKVTADFAVGDPPSWISTTLTTLSAIGSSAKTVAMGTAPPYSPVLAIYLPTNPTITLKDHNGVTIGAAMTFSMTPSAGEYLVIDIGRKEIYRNTSGLPGVGTESSCDWTGGTMLDFDYHNWDPISGTYGTIAISSGTGVLTYYQCDF